MVVRLNWNEGCILAWKVDWEKIKNKDAEHSISCWEHMEMFRVQILVACHIKCTILRKWIFLSISESHDWKLKGGCGDQAAEWNLGASVFPF